MTDRPAPPRDARAELAQPLERRLGAVRAGPTGIGVGSAGLAVSLVGAAFDAWQVLVPVAVLLGAGYGLCLAAGLTTVARLASTTERGALTGTFYACAYLGFGVPVLLGAALEQAGLTVMVIGADDEARAAMGQQLYGIVDAATAVDAGRRLGRTAAGILIAAAA